MKSAVASVRQQDESKEEWVKKRLWCIVEMANELSKAAKNACDDAVGSDATMAAVNSMAKLIVTELGEE